SKVASQPSGIRISPRGGMSAVEVGALGQPASASAKTINGAKRPKLRVPIRVTSSMSSVSLEQRRDELARLEASEIRDLLTHADPCHRQLELVTDADHHTTLGGPVQLGQGNGGEGHRFIELTGPLNRVLAHDRFEHEQDFVGRTRKRLAHHAMDLAKLLHEGGLGVEPTEIGR